MAKRTLNKESENNKISGATFSIKSDKDLIEIRRFGRTLARQIGFKENDQTLISTALSEIVRNVLEYASTGEATIDPDPEVRPNGVVITVSDQGPGIENMEKALREGYSTGNGLGVGLPGARRIMDQFEIQSESGKGTTVKMVKRLNSYEF